MQRDFLSFAIPVAALPSQAIAAAGTANGVRIVNPARYGRALAFLATIKGAGVTTLTIKLQGSNDLGVTWSDYLSNDGVTPLQFAGATTVAAGVLAGTSVLMGSIRLDRAKYQDFRIIVSAVAGATANVGVVAVIGDTYSGNPNQSIIQDLWLTQQLPLGSN